MPSAMPLALSEYLGAKNLSSIQDSLISTFNPGLAPGCNISPLRGLDMCVVFVTCVTDGSYVFQM